MATLTHDVRNAIHGLEVWPFGWKSLLVAVMRHLFMDIGVASSRSARYRAPRWGRRSWAPTSRLERERRAAEELRGPRADALDRAAVRRSVEDWPAVRGHASSRAGSASPSVAVPVMHEIIGSSIRRAAPSSARWRRSCWPAGASCRTGMRIRRSARAIASTCRSSPIRACAS